MHQFELPQYERNLPSFSEVFGVSALEVITEMDRSGDDIPEQEPRYSYKINFAGVRRDNIPVKILDPFGSNLVIQVLCSLEASTEVPYFKRGIHMSRVGDIIAKSTLKTYCSLQEYALTLAELLAKHEYQGFSQVKVSGNFPYLESVKGWKQEKDKISLEHLGLSASIQTKQESGYIQSAGLTVSNLTACPCVQSTYKHTLQAADKLSVDSVFSPFITHSQRCRTTVDILNLPIGKTLSIKSLLEVLDQSIVRVQNTLPREYELLMVYQAHKKPQFIEDVVREVAFKVSQVIKNDFQQSYIRVSSESMESIHDFDIQAELEDSVENLVVCQTNFDG